MVNDLKTGKLIKSPYFQRNLVWRDVHKKDFLDTILLGLPFPQIFIAQGDIDVETLESRSVVVDGQQRMNAISEYVADQFAVNGKLFSELDSDEKEEFLRYQIPVIDLDLKSGDPQIIDIFKRLNRTFYALSAIEKLSTEFATVDLMLIAKYSCGMFKQLSDDELDDESDSQSEQHPLMPDDFLPWIKEFGFQEYQKWLLKNGIFTEFEIARQVHLMFCLNLICTAYAGFYPRNEKPKEYLESGKELFPARDEVALLLEKTAGFLNRLELGEGSIWFSKSNSFSLFILLLWNLDAAERLGADRIRTELQVFAANLPEDYALAAREAVNNRKQRILRHEHLARLLRLQSNERKLERIV